MIDESKAIKARELVKSPKDIGRLTRPYVMLTDSSVNDTFDNLMDAIAMFADYGWEVTDMTTESMVMYVLLKNPHYKRKHRPDDDIDM